MKRSVNSIIDEFIKQERNIALFEAEIYSRVVLLDFLNMTGRGKGWEIGDITAGDIVKFREKTRKEYGDDDPAYLKKSLRVIKRFMGFCVKSGWVEEKPCGDIYTWKEEES